MKARWFLVPLALALAGALPLLGAGCKAATCESVCEHNNTCEGATKVDDCAALCDSTVKTNEAAGCTDEYDALLSCQGTVTTCDGDTVSTFCTAQNAAYLTCLNDACSDDPAACQGS